MNRPLVARLACLLLAILALSDAAEFEINSINFTPGSEYSTFSEFKYTDITVVFTVTSPSGLSPKTAGIDKIIKFELPHFTDTVYSMYESFDEMFFGTSQASQWKVQPGSDKGWSVYSSGQYPLIQPNKQYGLQGVVSGTQNLSYGYVGNFTVTNITTPQNCRYPGEYSLTIGSSTAYHRPVHKGVLCPEFHNLNVSFSNNNYDKTDINVTFMFQVQYYDFFDAGPTYLNPMAAPFNNLSLNFPTTKFPQTFQVGPNTQWFYNVDPSNGYVVPANNYGIQISSTTTVGQMLTPGITQALAGGGNRAYDSNGIYLREGYGRWPVGSWISITLTNVTTPWSCDPNPPYCVSVGYFQVCANLTNEIAGCPVLYNLSVVFTPSRYDSLNVDATFSFQFNGTNQLYIKPKYNVTFQFPTGVDFYFEQSYMKYVPFGLQASNSTLRSITFLDNTFDVDYIGAYVTFALWGMHNYEQDSNDVFIDQSQSVAKFIIGNVSLPDNCNPLPAYTLSIGPFVVSGDMTDEITDCAVLTNLNLTFSEPYQAQTGVFAIFHFDISRYNLWVNPLRITYPYYQGTGKRFKVVSSPMDVRHWAINGRTNADITVYRGLTYYFDIVGNGSNAHLFAIMQSVATGVGATCAGFNQCGTNQMLKPGAEGISCLAATCTVAECCATVFNLTDIFPSYSNGETGVYLRYRLLATGQYVDMDKLGASSFGNIANAAAFYIPYGRLLDSHTVVLHPGTTVAAGIRADPVIHFAELNVSRVWGRVHHDNGGQTNYRVKFLIYLGVNGSANPLWQSTNDDDTFDVVIPCGYAGQLYISANSSDGTDYFDLAQWIDVKVLVYDPVIAGSGGLTLPSGQLYASSGLFGNNICDGVITWTVDQLTPDNLFYQDTNHPLMWGRIIVKERPRGLNFYNARFGITSTDPSIVAPLTAHGDLGSAFEYQTALNWTHNDPLHFTVNYSADGVKVNETLYAFDGHNDGTPVPIGKDAKLYIWNVTLPNSGDCTDLGNMTVKIGPSVVSGNPQNDTIYCPVFNNISVTFSSHVRGAQNVVVNVSFDLLYAPLLTRDIAEVAIVLPRYSGVSISPNAYFTSVYSNWSLSPSGPRITNYPGVEISIAQPVVGGATVAAGTSRTWIAFSGLNLPMTCTDLGNYTLVIGQWSVEFNPGTDRVLCPNITDLEVLFVPSANQSATTNAIIAFNISDNLDPDTITIVFPPTLRISNVYFDYAFETSQMAGWQLNRPGMTINAQTNTLQIPLLYPGAGSRLPIGRQAMFLRNITLPRGNCSDLGNWTIAFGKLHELNVTMNPFLDVVENCVVIEDLVVSFSPDYEQGQPYPGPLGINMTFTFTIGPETSLWYVPGDSDEIYIEMPPEVGVRLGGKSQMVNIMGNWVANLTATQKSVYTFRQPLVNGTFLVSAGERTSFTITDVALPTFCVNPGKWRLRIGIWEYYGTPVNGTDLIGCPDITNVEVVYQPPIVCTQLATATVFFDVEKTRLRPGALRIDFPPDSGITIWPFARVIVAPGDWKSVGGSVSIVPKDPTCVHCLVVCNPGHEISYTESFTGTPLEVGKNYSFTISNIGIPCNNCTDLGQYRVQVSNTNRWNSSWTNPIKDVLKCPGVLTNINITTMPDRLTRMYPNATMEFSFLASICGEWNELWIRFPPGWEPGRNGSLPRIVASVGLVTANANISVVVEGNVNVLQIRNLTALCTTDGWYAIELTSIGAGNSCNEGEFVLSTQTFIMADRSAGQAPPIRWRSPTIGDAVGALTTTLVMPQDCTPCNACQFDFLLPDTTPVYSCENGKAKFQRIGPIDAGCSQAQTFSPNLW